MERQWRSGHQNNCRWGPWDRDQQQPLELSVDSSTYVSPAHYLRDYSFQKIVGFKLRLSWTCSELRNNFNNLVRKHKPAEIVLLKKTEHLPLSFHNRAGGNETCLLHRINGGWSWCLGNIFKYKTSCFNIQCTSDLAIKLFSWKYFSKMCPVVKPKWLGDYLSF